MAGFFLLTLNRTLTRTIRYKVNSHEFTHAAS